MGQFHKIILISIIAGIGLSTCENITVFRTAGFQGPSIQLSISDCLTTLDADWDKQFESINTHDNCVQLYQEQYCTGKYLVVRSGSHDHDNLGAYGFANKVRSIGLCFEKCHPDNVVAGAEVKVYLFDDTGSRPYSTITAPADKCIAMKNKLSRWSSQKHVKVKVPASFCVELHQFGDCTGPSVQLNVGGHSSVGMATYFPVVDNSLSLSLCGYNCNHSYALEQLDRDDIEPEDGSITLFRYIDFAGERTGLVIKGCTPLPKGWDERSTIPKSVISYGQCVEFYEDKGCKEGTVLEAVTGAEPYLVSGNKTIKAVKACPIVHIPAEASGGGSGFMIFFVVCCLMVIFVEAVVIYRMKRAFGGDSYRHGNEDGNLL